MSLDYISRMQNICKTKINNIGKSQPPPCQQLITEKQQTGHLVMLLLKEDLKAKVFGMPVCSYCSWNWLHVCVRSVQVHTALDLGTSNIWFNALWLPFEILNIFLSLFYFALGPANYIARNDASKTMLVLTRRGFLMDNIKI